MGRAGRIALRFERRPWRSTKCLCALGTAPFLSVLGAVLVGVPLYSDAVGIIPIAEVLLGKGVPLGTVLAFMMAVTALSLPEMVILRKVVRWPLLGVYAGYLASAFVVVGMLFNQLGVMR